METDERENNVDLNTMKRENRHLEREEKRAEYEIESWNKKFKMLQTEDLRIRQEGELERELEVCRNKCNELWVELEEKKMECVGFEDKFKELMSSKISVDNELNEYKMIYNGLKEQMTCLEEDRKVVCEREKKTRERISYLSEKMEIMENDDREKYADLKMEIRDLESGKRRVEYENEGLKKRLTELENEFLSLKHEIEVEKVEFEVCRTNCEELSVDLERKKMECDAIQDKFQALMLLKIAVDDELKECKTVCYGLKERIKRIEIDQNILCGSEKRGQEIIAQLLEELKQKEWDKLKDLMSRKIYVDEELNVYKITCNELKEQISRLEEYQKVTCGREQMAQQRITDLSEELKNMKRDERDKYVQLEAENQKLELAIKRAEDEIDVWKRRFSELQSRVLRVEEESSTLICVESHFSGDIKLEQGLVQTEISYNDDGKEERNRTTKLQSEAYDGKNIASLVHVTGTPSMDMQCVPSVNVEEERGNSLLECKLMSGIEFGKQLVIELEGSSNEMQSGLELGSIRPESGGGIIETSDDSSDSSSDKEKDLTPKKCLKRLYSGQRGGKYGGSCNVDSPFTSPARKRALEISCESDSEDANEIEKLQELKHEVLESSPRNMLSETPNACCGGHNTEEKKDWGERTSLNQLKMSGMSIEKVGNQTAKNGKEIMDQEFGSDREDESLGGVKLEGSDSSDSGYISSDLEDSGDLHLAFDNVLKKIFNKDKESNLKVEAEGRA